MAKKSEPREIRYGVVGLGYFAQTAILPAFANAKGSRLVALVSDDPDKLQKLGEDYGVETRVAYDGFDELCRSGDVDAVYIALPNSMHRDYTERAARHGVHVLCEKPLAVTSEDCEAMIRVTSENNVKLMTAYRLHFERANLKAAEMVRKGMLGQVRLCSSVFTMNVTGDNIRLQREMGGGPLWDIGIYCINAARTIFGAEPTEVFATGTRPKGDDRFREVHEQVAALLKFGDERLASFVISFGASDVSVFEIVGTESSLRLDPAFDFATDLVHTIRKDGKPTRKTFAKRDQVGPEISYFTRCILRNQQPEPSGHEGLADVRVIEALYQSMRDRWPVALGPFEKVQRPTMAQEEHEPPTEEPELFHAEPPSGS